MLGATWCDRAQLLFRLRSRGVSRVAHSGSQMARGAQQAKNSLSFVQFAAIVWGVARTLRESLANRGANGLAVRAGLALLAVVILVMPALDLAWNEPKLAERGTPCPLHANPVLVVCGAALDVGQAFGPGAVAGEPLRPQPYDASIFIPPKL